MTEQNQAADAAKKQAADEKAARDKKQAEQRTAATGKPTPTQEENDRRALGEAFPEHEPDGSGPDPYAARQVEAKPGGGGYQTRAQTPQPHTTTRRHET